MSVKKIKTLNTFFFFVKVFKSKHTSNNSDAWQPFPAIFEIFLLHNYLYIVLFIVPNRFANASVGHDICTWAWIIRKLAYPLSSLPLPH